ncbi:MAG: hypothetical protein P4L71_14300 [Acetobacteraceae bacterium]|nr:hypothetical protein [Acetobacteraceae bacterium]
MKPDVKLTAYDKRTDRMIAAALVPQGVIAEARRIAKVPATDPELSGAYPLTVDQVTQIAGKAGFTLDPGRYDYCLEAFLPKVEARTHAGPPKTRKERAKLNAARARERAVPETA